jgi:hypothetical protein
MPARIVLLHGALAHSIFAKQLSEPAPYDLSEIDLHHYRGLLARWQDWTEVVTVCRQLAVAVLAHAAEERRAP